jgi:hypothetical protein
LLNFCTISTASYLFKASALADSIMPYNAILHVLVIDKIPPLDYPANIKIYQINDIRNEYLERVLSKYGRDKDKLRWALKPIFLLYLLDKAECVAYVDNDQYFYSDPTFIFNMLNDSSIILTPHHYQPIPSAEANWFEANFRVGLFNAGFIGASTKAKDALDWWVKCCIYNIKKAYWRGLFDDQKYLDMMPVLFDNVKILKHPGCNLAGWNDYQLIDDLVFIHFAEITLSKFLKPEHSYHQFAQTYIDTLKKYNPQYTFKKHTRFYEYATYVYFLRWKIARMFES